jgi:hypothetical protein
MQMWPVALASYQIPNAGKVPSAGSFEPHQSTPSIFITGHVGKLCVWDASCPWSLDLLHCIDLPKNDVKVTCIHVDMTASSAFISAGCDTGDVWVFRSRDGPSADVDADSASDADLIGPFVLHYSMPIHVSSVHCLVYSAALARLAIGDTDAVFTLSDIVSGQTLCYEMLNSVAVADASSSQAPEAISASTDAVVTSLAFAPWSIADGEATSLTGTSINAVLVGLSSGRLLAFSVTEGKPLFDYAFPAVGDAGAASTSVASVEAAWPRAIRFCAAMDVESRTLVCELQMQAVAVAPVGPSIALPAAAASEPVDADPGAPEAPLQQPGDATSIAAHATLPEKVSDKTRVLIVASGQHVALYEMVPLSRTSAHPVKYVLSFQCLDFSLRLEFHV